MTMMTTTSMTSMPATRRREISRAGRDKMMRAAAGGLRFSQPAVLSVGARRTGTAMAFRNAPEPQTEDEEGSVLDFPEEYVRAVPSRRPDIFPDLKEPKTPMPRPMPGTFVRSFVRPS